MSDPQPFTAILRSMRNCSGLWKRPKPGAAAATRSPVQPALDCSHPVGRDFCDSSAPVCSPSLQPHTSVSLLRRAEERCHEAKGKAKGNKSSVSSDFSIVFSSTLFSCQVYRSRYVLGRFRSTSTLLSPALQASLGKGAHPFSFSLGPRPPDGAVGKRLHKSYLCCFYRV